MISTSIPSAASSSADSEHAMERMRPGEHGHGVARADKPSLPGREDVVERAHGDVPADGPERVVLDHEHRVLAEQRGVE